MMTQPPMRRRRTMTVVASLVLAVFCGSVPARAQLPGDLSGFVYDQTGTAVAGVRVTVRGAEARSGETNAAGSFAFQRLPEGAYDVVAELQGFQPARRSIRARRP